MVAGKSVSWEERELAEASRKKALFGEARWGERCAALATLPNQQSRLRLTGFSALSNFRCTPELRSVLISVTHSRLMFKRLLNRHRRPAGCQLGRADEACPVAACPLAACRNGHRAVVVSVDCPAAEACRLRALGVYEGANVAVVDSRNGLLLQVRGSRLAIGAAVAAAITVIPLTP